jgi:hypothetical protein
MSEGTYISKEKLNAILYKIKYKKMASSPRLDGVMSSSMSAASPRVENVMSSSMSAAMDKHKIADQRRLWEDDLETVNVPSLYNRMNFATVPRKSANKKTW